MFVVAAETIPQICQRARARTTTNLVKKPESETGSAEQIVDVNVLSRHTQLGQENRPSSNSVKLGVIDLMVVGLIDLRPILRACWLATFDLGLSSFTSYQQTETKAFDAGAAQTDRGRAC